MIRLERLAAWPLAICMTMVLAGCSGSDSAPESTSASTQATAEFDLSKLSQLEDDMPPGFVPYPSEVRRLQQLYVAGVGSVVSNGKPFEADPPQCHVLLKPVDGQAGAESVGIRADGTEKRTIAVGADVPVSVPAQIPTVGCERLRYTVPDDDQPRSGTAERIAAPDIDGATTYALELTTDGFGDPEYYYAAILDDRVYVDVQARLAPEFDAEPVLAGLLREAVSVIRG
ncbi:hypothetical protein A5765_01815 [Mycolicibacterium celeriflavum]|uniref:DUF5642 family protein n=1 Tax=Mycolicibacterium celeriflavum TaxID=1249101 RepID=UPI0007FEF7AE|nr:DUF5642 family protein [Mycolicibacterium celeriflavum]OBG19814.1 hypothetical protein A5765_01815 [Mycolicibacterium celeriflavum]